MSELVIFKDVTTEDVIKAFEIDAEKYTGLYVDMNDDDGRRYVKAQASTIADILKNLDRARIDKSKDYKAAVEREASAIKARLEKANEPYTLLINEYNAERKRILDAEKAREKAIEDQAAIDADYEFAVLMMERDFNQRIEAEAERERNRIAYEEQVRFDAEQKANADAEQKIKDALDKVESDRLAEIKRQADIKAAKGREDAKRAADAEHVKQVRVDAIADLVATGVPQEFAVIAIKAINGGAVRNVSINY